jgi:hypothetical protein
MIAGTVAESNGPRPVAAYARTLPREKTSLSGPSRSPRTCSGDMKENVPMSTPEDVNDVASAALAMPKSMIRGPSSAMMTLPG